MERRIIFRVNLSPEKSQAVFLHSTKELFSLEELVHEEQGLNCRYLSLSHFLRLAKAGDLDQVEMLFNSTLYVHVRATEWDPVFNNRHFFLSHNFYKNALNFATEQLELITPKNSSDNIKNIINKINTLSVEEQRLNFDKVCVVTDNNVLLGEIPIESYLDDVGELVIRIGGKSFRADIQTKLLRDKLRSLEVRLGSRRTEEPQYDYNFSNVSRAMRLIDECIEALTTNNITFPRPDAEFLDKLASGQISLDSKLCSAFKNKIAQVVELIRSAPLVNSKAINDISIKIQSEFYGAK